MKPSQLRRECGVGGQEGPHSWQAPGREGGRGWGGGLQQGPRAEAKVLATLGSPGPFHPWRFPARPSPRAVRRGASTFQGGVVWFSGAPGLLRGGSSLQCSSSQPCHLDASRTKSLRTREGEGLVQGHRGCQDQEQDVAPQCPTPLPPLNLHLNPSPLTVSPFACRGAVLLNNISAIVTKQADDAELKTVICFNNNNSNNNLAFIEHLFYARLRANRSVRISR